MTYYRNDPDVVRDILLTPATWAVVGLSENRARPAYRVAAWLQAELGKRLIPVHPSAPTMFGEQGYATLADIPTGNKVQVVDCFVNSDRVGEVIDQAIAEKDRLGIRAIWMQLGVIDVAARKRAEEAGLAVVMDSCPKIEFPRLKPGDGSDTVIG